MFQKIWESEGKAKRTTFSLTDAYTLVLVSILGGVAGLMVEGNTSVEVGAGHAWATMNAFRHLGTRAGSTVEVSIAANGGEGVSSSEVVIRDGVQSAVTVMGGGSVRGTVAAS